MSHNFPPFVLVRKIRVGHKQRLVGPAVQDAFTTNQTNKITQCAMALAQEIAVGGLGARIEAIGRHHRRRGRGRQRQPKKCALQVGLDSQGILGFTNLAQRKEGVIRTFQQVRVIFGQNRVKRGFTVEK